MTSSRHSRGAAVAVLLSLLFFACALEEDLQINADGSGTYRVKLTIPKDLSSDFGDFKKDAAKNGFSIVEEGQTEKERFLMIRKDFTEITSLNDGHNVFELNIGKVGWLKRAYRLRASLQAVGYGSFKRNFVVTMPGEVTTSNQGEIDGSRVRWDATNGGSIEIMATGYAVPLSRNQGLLVVVVALGVALLVVGRKRAAAAPALCSACDTSLARKARFCAACGARASIA
jgi:hypothetical protein